MSNVISQVDIQKYKDNEEVVFPEGTIITPTARDFAKDHNLKITIGEIIKVNESDKSSEVEIPDREECLKMTAEAVICEFRQNGMEVDIDTAARAVKICLERMECTVLEN